MSQTIMPGSYTALFSQALMKSIMQMAGTNPLAASTSPTMAQMDLGLAQSVQSLDAMLATVGLGAGTGIGGVSPLGGGFSALA